MISAFGVDHGGIDGSSIYKSEESDRKKNVKGSVIAGAGGVTATTGLAAGGIPGAKSDFTSVFRVKPGQGKGARKVASTIRGAAPAAKAAPGGILGFRAHAHQGGTAGFMQGVKEDTKTKPKDAADAFYRGRNAGKIRPELKMLRGMGKGRKVANAALVGGSAVTGYGLHERKKVSKSRRDVDTYNASLVGAAGTGAVATHAVPKFLDSKRKKYEASASRNVDEAGKLVQGLAGRQGKKLTLRQMHKHKVKKPGQPFPQTMYPTVSDSAVKRDPSILHGVDHATARKAGRLRGAATQDRHFAEVLGNTAKHVRRFRTPTAVAATVGAGGLAASGHRKKGS